MAVGTKQLQDGATPISPTAADGPTDASSTSPQPPAEDTRRLLSRARAFLQSPQIASQDIRVKQQFLQEKGLKQADIESLLREMPPPAPLIPPRTYPQPPPSNLPNLLLGLSRIFSWLTGCSALLIFIYYRFILPRIARSSMARHSLKSHHLMLLQRLTASLSSFKENQAESWSVLPKTEPWREPTGYNNFSSIEDITKSLDKEGRCDKVHPVTILRCGLADLGKDKGTEQKPTADELFRYLEEKIPWLVSTQGLKFERYLWEVLSSCPSFTASPLLSPSPATQEPHSLPCWTYSPPLPPSPSPVIKSLSSLKLSLPKGQASRPSAFQNTLQALSEFTGYISTQVYMPYRPPASSVGMGGSLGPIEEQLRREIRALKGLVLNRRSFMPPTARVAAAAST